VTPADYITLGLVAGFVLAAGIACAALEKEQRRQRNRWQRRALITEAEIVAQEKRRLAWPFRSPKP